MHEPSKFLLTEDRIPTAWVNVLPSLSEPLSPPLSAEGIVPAPESSHAIRAAMDEALAAREAGRGKVILFGLSGHGHFDMSAYESYLSGKLQGYEYPSKAIEKAMAEL